MLRGIRPPTLLRRVRPPTLLLGILAVLAGGCGNSRTPAASLDRPAAPVGFHRLVLPTAGIALEAPLNWIMLGGRLPLVATISSGPATVAVWRYLDRQPSTAAAGLSVSQRLRYAQAALVRSAEARNPGLRLLRARNTTVLRLPAVILATIQSIMGQQRRVRSIHLFGPGYEIVIEESAPAATFSTLYHGVFSSIERSLAPAF